jgi:hypothetical protein
MDEITSLRWKARVLAVLYAVLLGISVLVLVLQSETNVFTPPTTLAWVLALGAAVATRLHRNAVVDRYNAIAVSHRVPPLE